MEIERYKTVAFTGYRTHKILRPGIPVAVLENIRCELKTVLRKLYGEGYRVFLSGMAEGFDLLAAEEVLLLKQEFSDVKLIGVLPFRKQALKYSRSDRERYESILRECSFVELLSEQYYQGCYFARNDFLVEHCSVIICYYDGQKGGTEYTVKRAGEAGIPVINLYDKIFGLF